MDLDTVQRIYTTYSASVPGPSARGAIRDALVDARHECSLAMSCSVRNEWRSLETNDDVAIHCAKLLFIASLKTRSFHTISNIYPVESSAPVH